MSAFAHLSCHEEVLLLANCSLVQRPRPRHSTHSRLATHRLGPCFAIASESAAVFEGGNISGCRDAVAAAAGVPLSAVAAAKPSNRTAAAATAAGSTGVSTPP